jgi:conjugal transfer pilus assembly protein TraV
MILWKWAATAVAATMLVGCAASGRGEFSCRGLPQGVSCLPASTVYEITSDPALEKAFREELQRRRTLREDVDPAQVLNEVRARTGHGAANALEVPLMQAVRQPLPVLEPARVVRIWIAPWVDNKGDLRMPGYVFSEITPRRWSFGEAQIDQTNVLVPIQVERDVKPPPPTTAKRAAPTPPVAATTPPTAGSAAAVQRAAAASAPPPLAPTAAAVPVTSAAPR